MIEFSPDGRRVLLGTDRAVSLWDLEQRGKPVRVARFENFPDNITAVDHWSPPYGFVAVTEINIWLLRTDADEVIRICVSVTWNCPTATGRSTSPACSGFPCVEPWVAFLPATHGHTGAGSGREHRVLPRLLTLGRTGCSRSCVGR